MSFSLKLTPPASPIPESVKIPHCEYFDKPEIDAPSWIARKFEIDYSSEKLMATAHGLRGCHINQAIEAMNASQRKGGPIVSSVLRAAKKNGTVKGFDPDRMYVKEVFVGRKNGGKKLEIKGRGKMGVQTKPISSLTVRLEERPMEFMIRDVLSGEADPGIGHAMRQQLFQANADYEDIKKFSHFLTSKGRYYRRTQFKRLVEKISKEKASQGQPVRKSKIEEYLLNTEVAKIMEARIRDETAELMERKSDRMAHFEENYKKK